MPATLKDVSVRANVSASTVSRALSHPDMVAAKTLARVLKAARELNYHPNEMARGLRKKSSQAVGLIIADILNPFYARVAKGVEDAIYQQGYNLFLCSTNEDSERERRSLQVLIRQQVQGLIIVPTEETRKNLKKFSRLAIVEVDRVSGHTEAHAVLSENLGGAKAAVQHLIALGHKRIATVTGRQSVTTGAERLEGYLQAMREAGLAVNEAWVVLSHDHAEKGGYDAALQLFNVPENLHPTAVLVFNNESTAGALKVLREKGLLIPRDVSIIGFDDSRWAQLMEPPLTVIAQPAYDLGYLAGQRLFSLIEGRHVEGNRLRLPAQLTIRSSTAPPRSG